MERYRTTGPLDDPPMTEGDDGWVGVDSYNSAENLQPGMAQAAVNTDFTTQDAATRGGFVCLPATITPVMYSWTARTASSVDLWQNVAYGNGLYVAVATDHVMSSPNGIVWTNRAIPTGGLACVAFGNNTFVAVGGPGVILSSVDGIAWTQRTSPSSNTWSSVTHGAGIFVAVAKSGTGDRVMISSDGVLWVGYPATIDNLWTGVTYGNGIFVAVASNGTGDGAMYSSDGTSWTVSVPAEDNNWNSITYGNGVFVAVASGGTNQVMISPDGAAWVGYPSAAAHQYQSVAFGGGVFAAVASTGPASERTMISRDGKLWVNLTATDTSDWQGIGFGNDLFVAVASDDLGVGSDHAMTFSPACFASGVYSDPNDPGSQWIMLVASTAVGFYAAGRTARSVAIDSAQSVSQMSTIVQCNNLVYLFRGSSETPLYWTGNWGDEFELAPTPTPGPGFSIIPNSNQATFYQNRLWVINGKDIVSASDVLDFTSFDELANEFNLNTGSSDYLVTTYPFGENALIVFKNKSIVALQNVQGALDDVTATEITRQVGCIGINAIVSVGPDMVYMSDRNINLITLTSTNNALQHKTLPLSTPIQSIIRRVNWQAASKVSMGYTDNKLYVALPLDNATSCNAVVVYNFVTESWFGEWAFALSLGVAIQGWVVANYLGVQRMHCITEDGRIFVTGEGHQDISGATVAEVATSLTTRAYKMDNNNRINRRMWVDLSTNRPDFSVTSYVDGANEYSEILSGQTFSRTDSWIFSDSAYDMTNANDDYNRAGRKDYSSGPDSIESGTGFLPEMTQDYRFPILTRGKGRLTWFNVSNETGFISINGIGAEARAGDRGNLVQVL